MKTRILTLLGALAALAILFAHVRIQPSGMARVVRHDASVSTLGSRVGWSPRYLGSSCLAPLEGGRVLFREEIEAATAEGEPFGFETTFRYRVPETLPKRWGDGTWCESLGAAVTRSVAEWLRGTDRERLLADPRAAGWSAAEALQADLHELGVSSSEVAVRPQVSDALRQTVPVAEIASKAVKRPPVVVLALDGADWDLLDPLTAEGRMPHLGRLLSSGSRGILETQHPPLSPIVWTTMMTGVTPLEHRVLDFTRFNPITGRKEPITTDERQVPAIWNMASAAGKRVAVFGLWATYPAEPVNGFIVSDRFFTFLFSEDDETPGTVFPSWREAGARQVLRQVEDETDYERLRAYLPWLSREEYEERKTSANPYGQPVSALRRIFVETDVYDRLAAKHFEEARPDLQIVFIQGTDSVGHVFAPFMPPRQDEIDPAEFERYSGVASQYFEEVDALIGRWMERIEKANGTLVLVSDHGFHWHEGRPIELSSFAATTAAKWHRKEGIWALWGAGAARGRGGAASAQQVAATLLALTGLPRGEHVLGPPFGGVGPMEVTVDYAQLVPRPRVEVGAATGEADEEIAKLRALGYIGAGEQDTRPESASGSTRTAGSWNNEGLVLRDQRKDDAAEAVFRRALEVDPNLASALWNLSELLYNRKELDEADALLTRAYGNGLPEGKKYLIGRAIAYQRAGNVDRSLALLDRGVGATPQDPELWLFRGRYRVELGRCREALEDFRSAQRLTPEDPAVWSSAGVAASCLGDPGEAARNFRRSLALNPNQPRLQRYLAEGGF